MKDAANQQTHCVLYNKFILQYHLPL
jgi:hypothetical protein